MKNCYSPKECKFFCIVFLLILSSSQLIKASDRTVKLPAQDYISVFADFPFHQQYVRENITFVNYVRDRELSEIHIMMTRYGSGSAGENYIISFIGRNRFEGINNVITYWAPGTNTTDETRRQLVETIQIGLVPYLATTRMRRQISVRINTDHAREREPIEDPWKNWVFEIYGGGNFHKEETQSRYDARWGGMADKTSDDWKVRLRPYFNINERTFIKNKEETIVTKQHRHGFNGNVVRSISGHLSTGIFTNVFSSSFDNVQFSLTASPGVEYSFFPYSEASRKAIKLVYYVGGGYYDYIEMTRYLKYNEWLASHSLNFSLAYQQPWGGMNTSVSGSHYFHDLSAYRISFWGRLDLRLVKGLTLNMHGNFHFIHDLLSIAADKDLSLEDLLLQQRRQSTNYQVSGSVGLSYRFGSQFSNVVNTRF